MSLQEAAEAHMASDVRRARLSGDHIFFHLRCKSHVAYLREALVETQRVFPPEVLAFGEAAAFSPGHDPYVEDEKGTEDGQGLATFHAEHLPKGQPLVVALRVRRGDKATAGAVQDAVSVLDAVLALRRLGLKAHVAPITVS